MASGKRIGFYIAESKYYFVESSDNHLLRIVISPPLLSGEPGPSEDIRLIASIQKTMRDNKLTQSEVRFSIAQADVIFRSFLIPVIKSSEINAVVDYELRKHIPFDIKEFTFVFNTIKVVDNKVKKLRVLLAATRQVLVERYEQMLNQAKLNVVVSDPAPSGLIRVLFVKKIVSPTVRFALIQIENTIGRIIFVHEGMVLFIREFQMNLSAQLGNAQDDEALMKARFVNEIQNSLDFFTRAHENMVVSQLVILRMDVQNSYDQWLQEDINIPTKMIDVRDLIGSVEAEDVSGVLYAFGASLADVNSPTLFNLSRRAVKKSSAPSSVLADVDFREYVTAIKTAVIVVMLLTVLYFFFQYKIDALTKTKANLSLEQGNMADLLVTDIESKIDDNKIKLKKYNSLIIKNTLINIFINISNALPEGLWLTNLNIKNGETSSKAQENVDIKSVWEVTFNAIVYTADPMQEIKIVNDFMARLRKNKDLAKYVSNITLVNMHQQEINAHKVVIFSVKCN
jgi:Tfp pilus assembly protein PilN